MTAAGRLGSLLLFFIITLPLVLCCLDSDSALCSMSVQRLHLSSRAKVSCPLSRVFGRTFYRSISNITLRKDRHDVGSSYAYHADRSYSREELLASRLTGQRPSIKGLNTIVHFKLLRYRARRAGRRTRHGDEGETLCPSIIRVSRDRPYCQHQQ